MDVIIPNFDYLKDNKDKIKAIFITHGHDDVMGALPYLLQEVNVPIYTTDLTADLIDQLLQRYMRHSHVSYKYKIKRVNMNATIKVAGVEVDFFPDVVAGPLGKGSGISKFSFWILKYTV